MMTSLRRSRTEIVCLAIIVEISAITGSFRSKGGRDAWRAEVFLEHGDTSLFC